MGCVGGPTITGSESIQRGIISEFKLLVAGSRQIALWFSTNFCPVLLTRVYYRLKGSCGLTRRSIAGGVVWEDFWNL